MAMEAIRQVTQTEQEGQRLRDEAAAVARQTVAQAEREGKQTLENARKAAQTKGKEMLDRSEKQAAQTTAQTLDEARQDCDELLRSARARLDKAAALIVERVVNE